MLGIFADVLKRSSGADVFEPDWHASSHPEARADHRARQRRREMDVVRAEYGLPNRWHKRH